MKKISGYVLTMILGIVVMLSLAASSIVYAHGHHGSGHHGSAAANYYCGGHEAHLHENGVCPYAIQGINSSDAAKSIMKFGSPIFFRLVESIGCRWRE